MGLLYENTDSNLNRLIERQHNAFLQLGNPFLLIPFNRQWREPGQSTFNGLHDETLFVLEKLYTFTASPLFGVMDVSLDEKCLPAASELSRLNDCLIYEGLIIINRAYYPEMMRVKRNQ